MISARGSAIAVVLCLQVFTGYAQDYFQQRVDYRIKVALDDQEHRLTGQIAFDYFNQAPVALDTIFIHLWPNAYVDRSTPLAAQLREQRNWSLEYSTPEERGAITGLNFTIDGTPVQHHTYRDQVDIAYLVLPSPLMPQKSLTVASPFVVKIPDAGISRLGHVGESYQVTQWYPKPAVYDHEGWHPMSYYSQGEFFSEFGSFDVSITLPANYVVGATGELLSISEQDFIVQRVKETKQGLWPSSGAEFPGSSSTEKTLRYYQEDIHDFAWFADKRFGILHQAFELEPDGKEVQAYVYFTNRHKATWAKSLDYVIDGTRHYSRLVGEYPYTHVSVVDGTISAGGGMEYPMITVINGTSNEHQLERVVVHEIGHNWFYGILGSNERSHAWMDEGVNSYYENRYFEEKYQTEGDTRNLKSLIQGKSSAMSEVAYRYSACRHQDQPLSTNSEDFSNINYGTMVYMKGAKIMGQLNNVVGKAQFDKAMQVYYDTWKFKHPSQQAMRLVLESELETELGWFFDELVDKNAKVDHKICCYDNSNQSIKVRSLSSYEGPIEVGFYHDDTLVKRMMGEGAEFNLSPGVDYSHARIDPDYESIQLKRRNDELRTRGPFKTWAKPEIKTFSSIGLSNRPTAYFLPVLAWNDQDKWMFGAYLSNVELLYKEFEWTLMPMYSIHEERLTGMAELRQTFWLSETGPAKIDVSIKGKRFSLNPAQAEAESYAVLRPNVEYEYKDPGLRGGKHRLGLGLDLVFLDGASSEKYNQADQREAYYQGYYAYDLGMGLADFGLLLDAELHEDFKKVEIDVSLSHVYNKRNKRLHLRGYTAKLWTEETLFAERLSINGVNPGTAIDGRADDYRFEHLFLARGSTDGLLDQQLVRNRGGFVQTTPYGRSSDWVSALNAAVDLPVPLPLQVYGSLGFYASSPTKTRSLYEVGGRVVLIRDIFDISFPFFHSQEITDYYESNRIVYGETIRFQLRTELLSIRKLIDNLQL